MFTVSAVVTVLGMFAYLGTAYATSIRLSAIQEYTPLKTAIGFVLLNIMGVVLFPVSSRVLQRFNPGWVLAAGMALIGLGVVVLAATPATNLSIAAIALTNAANAISSKIAGSPKLQAAVDAFHALSHAYAIGYLVCGIAALLAAVIAAAMLGGRQHTHAFIEPADLAESH